MKPSQCLFLALLSCAMLPAPPARSAPVAAPAAVSAATDDLAERVRALAQPAIDDGRVAGMVIGVVDKKGTTRLFGFGRISRADPRPPDGKTVFEIGSVSKVFTSALLADLVERKVVALDDPIKKYLPPAVKVPSHGGREITLAHLATHSSGLPRMPANFAPKDPKNPYADYGGRPAVRVSVVVHARPRSGRALRILEPGRGLAGPHPDAGQQAELRCAAGRAHHRPAGDEEHARRDGRRPARRAGRGARRSRPGGAAVGSDGLRGRGRRRIRRPTTCCCSCARTCTRSNPRSTARSR